MRPVVALVEARPETILDDYRRLLDLAGLEVGDSRPLSLMTPGERDCPGFVAPPWQIDGVLRALGTGTWADVSGRALSGDVRLETPTTRTEHGADSAIVAPGRQGLLLAAPVLEAGWGIRGAVALAWRFGGRGASFPRGALLPDLARVLGGPAGGDAILGAVLDGVHWGVGAGTLGKGYVRRNTLIAGADPVAVDAVGALLAGMDPLQIPWLRHCHDLALGTADPGRIRIAGHADLLGDSFAGWKLAGKTPGGRLSLSRAREGVWKAWRRPRLLKSYGETPWGRLDHLYRSGRFPEEVR
ncbi:DUF362 domain-containing protein [bacterium]|nr:DUF362 domain-containing protein [bacterium]